MITNNRTMNNTTTTELNNSGRTVTCAASAFLFEHFGCCNCHFSARLHLVCASAAFGKLPLHHTRNNIGARCDPKDCIGKRNVASGLVVDCFHINLHDPYSFSASASAAAGASATTSPDGAASTADSSAATSSAGASSLAGARSDSRPAGNGASSGRATLMASLIKTQPFFGPGTAPQSRTTPSSLSTATTSIFCVVLRAAPMWPAIFLPLNTLPGS